ncbi:signal transduction histidine kinase [Kitasatospora sp. SolWspMP-SS2h]|uniref:sensor histidine kinase n=1 Tax=Kitasatospora sp. SolWspMP-SS2h TaxID=1305729 RepID=UPI000DC00160|nr:sensor histidine kinase [Kitasatospora sp. SolWspMP-SS2h]RAJ44097.1 signal transduction histidine kinase [Kitasatospora sp. SolWspMP-SS2h]
MRIGARARQLRADPAVVDGLLAVVLAAVAVAYSLQAYEARYRADGRPAFDGWAIGLSLAANLPLALRRRLPRAVLALSCGALLTYTLAGYQPSVNLWAPLLACYTVVARRPAGEAAAASVLTGGAWVVSGLAAELSPVLAVAQSVLGIGAVWIFGAAFRRLGEHNARLAELTERLRREQELRARHAVVEERVRIARELHDVVAHHLSALSVQAGLAQYVFASDPAAAREALASIGTTSREALEEMRGLLRVLRVAPDGEAEEEGLYHSAPGLDRLDDLVARTRSAGVAVEVAVTGEVRPLPPGADLCAFRVVQEALTNVIKHAGRSAAARVVLEYGADRLTGRVVDDGRGAGAPAGSAVPGSGLGLIGVGERVRLYGGSVHTGPRPQGGFEVVFSIPVPASRTR